MKKILGIVVAAVIVLSSCKQTGNSSGAKTENDSLSYMFGVYFASSVKPDVKELNMDQVKKGFVDYYKADTFKMDPNQINQELNRLYGKLAERMAAETKVESQKFLDENKKKSGVVTLPSGLQYQVIKDGTGPLPDTTAVVSVHYIGTLINGEEFDNSYKRGEPAKFPVKGMIPGFSEALQKMKVGSKWKIFIPSNLAYGEQGTGQRGSKIKPNMALIFELEVLGIEPPQSEQPMPAAPTK